MEKIISISFGELFLKGKNRNKFIDLAKENIKSIIKDIDIDRVYSEHSKFYIVADEGLFDEIIARLQMVFGIAYVSPTIRCEKTVADMKRAISEYIKEYQHDEKTFKIITNRADKSFSPKSPELNNIFGSFVLKNFDNLRVDVHNPDLEVNVDIRTKNAYIYGKKYDGPGGLPVGSSGRGLALLSGGIDSPVAAYMMAKRGVRVNMVHYNSYPFTSDRSLEKVKDLARIVSRYIGDIKLYNVNILDIQKEINEKCKEENMTILSRRFMMRIAGEIAKSKDYKMLITGESLGQVASQTIEGLTATNFVSDIPVLRPLIGMDKSEIMEISKKIATYETSILPYEDCCTVFQADKPNIRPSLEEMEEEEDKLDLDGLIEEAIKSIEVIDISPSY